MRSLLIGIIIGLALSQVSEYGFSEYGLLQDEKKHTEQLYKSELVPDWCEQVRTTRSICNHGMGYNNCSGWGSVLPKGCTDPDDIKDGPVYPEYPNAEN